VATGGTQPGQVLLDARAADVVEDEDVLAVFEEAHGEVGADEAAAADDRHGPGMGDLQVRRTQPGDLAYAAGAAFGEEAPEKFRSALCIADAQMIVPWIEPQPFLHGQVGPHVLKSVPVDAVGGRLERGQEPARLLHLVVAPGG